MRMWLRRGLYVLVILAVSNLVAAVCVLPLFYTAAGNWLLPAALILLVLLVMSLVRPLGRSPLPTRRIRQLAGGTELLRLFLATATVNTVSVLWFLWLLAPWAGADSYEKGIGWLVWGVHLLLIVAVEASVFWAGMIRVYMTSVQLGVKHRLLAALCGWVPLLNIWYLLKIIRITSDEVEFETEKWELDAVRAESEICKTRYPILMVHGVFFRDYRYVNYWGRIPKELARNGATIYYGGQQSAAAVEDSGRELAARIRQIVEETGCGKVNIIAHSKGGLDSRAAIAHQGMGPYVATLTTINTPHRGCIFAEYLLNKIPEAVRQRIADTYNAALRRLGDEDPDFLAAVTDLTATACEKRNADTPDDPTVVYESVMSYCRKARHGKFPLNMTQPVVKYFDGRNDGLVAVDSARWGSRFTLLEPVGRRGISHGDMVDLNRENIPGFDVREFYVNLVASLKQRGF